MERNNWASQNSWRVVELKKKKIFIMDTDCDFCEVDTAVLYTGYTVNESHS
jgi:hypothetical protein